LGTVARATSLECATRVRSDAADAERHRACDRISIVISRRVRDEGTAGDCAPSPELVLECLVAL
jgi:hypothetical protein